MWMTSFSAVVMCDVVGCVAATFAVQRGCAREVDEDPGRPFRGAWPVAGTT